MREILFRAKRLDNGEWVEGFFSDETFYGNMPDDDRVFIIQKGTGFYYPVTPATVGQFTGLLDESGKRIFEGDILRGEWFPDRNIPEQYTFVVKWHETGWAVEEKPYPPELLLDEKSLDGCEIIGNIHDNPELPKGGQA